MGEKPSRRLCSTPFARLLGPIQVVDELGRAITAPSVTQRRLLGVLAIHNGSSVRSENLADILGVTIGALRQTVARLRTSLGPNAIQTDPTGYRLGLPTDAECFVSTVVPSRQVTNEAERVAQLQLLDSVLTLWHGEALEEFCFEPWAQGEATRLNELRSHCRSDRIELLIDLSRFAEAIADSHTQIALNPLAGRPHGLLIRALAGAGRQTEALRAYQTYRSFLAEEMGTEPTTDVQHIEQRVATGWRGTDVIVEREDSLVDRHSKQPLDNPKANQKQQGQSKGIQHLRSGRSNVPAPVTSWIGSREHLTYLAKELSIHRVTTLTGSGGVGKTRSAIEIARLCIDAEDFADGVLFFELAAIGDPTSLVSVVASSLSIQAQNNMSLTEAIVDWLQGRSMLLIFDNCEHVLESVCTLISDLVKGCETLAVLTTSRERLGIQGERVTQIQMLDPHDSVSLFCERALSVDDTLEFDDNDIATIESICQQLDCIPLAIELAASRIRAFSPDDVLQRLDQRFSLLEGNRSDGLAHQRTLRSAVDWSYQLLSPQEQRLFDLISIFSGSFNLKAVELICAHSDTQPLEIAKILASLAEKSMVVVERKAQRVRYRLLETLRQFGAEQLEKRGGSDALRFRHLHHYVTVCEQEHQRWFSTAQFEADAVLDDEWDNIRAAISHAGATNQFGLGERLAVAIVPYAVHRMRCEHRDWCNDLIEMERARAVDGGMPFVTTVSGTFRELNAMTQAADETEVDLKPQPAEPQLSAMFLGWTAWWTMIGGAYERTIELCKLGQQRASSEGDPGNALCNTMEASALFVLGRRHEGRQVGQDSLWVLDRTEPWLEFTFRRALFVVSSGSEFEMHANRLAELAERFGSPSLIASARFYQGFAKMLSATPDFASAAVFHEEGVQLARLARAPFAESQNLQGLLEAKLALNTSDVLTVCGDALHRIHDFRHWVYLWRVVDIAALVLARHGRLREAALVIGHLEAHVPGWRPEPRNSTKALLSLDSNHDQSLHEGVAMDRDFLVRLVIDVFDELEND
jgi:predicted ATPase/DNA-binding SARP family transcriptional activator